MDKLELYDTLKEMQNGVCAIQCVDFAMGVLISSDVFEKGLSYIAEHMDREFNSLLDQLKAEGFE